MKDRLITIAMSVSATLGLTHVAPQRIKELDVDRLIVRQELIVSDTGSAWEEGFEPKQIARGIYARSLYDGPGGLWVRSRLIKTEIDDPFDDRFHAINSNGAILRAPGHISWNVWVNDNWRQLAILQGEGLEYSEVPEHEWDGGNHPGRLRFQSFRPGHGEPLTDVLIGQGKMSIGGGGFGGGGLPYPSEAIEIWGGKLITHEVSAPDAPVVMRHDGSGKHVYSIVAIGVQGTRTPASPTVESPGIAALAWDSAIGADAYVVVRDGKEITPPIRIEGSRKEWMDPAMKP